MADVVYFSLKEDPKSLEDVIVAKVIGQSYSAIFCKDENGKEYKIGDGDYVLYCEGAEVTFETFMEDLWDERHLQVIDELSDLDYLD